MSSDTPSVAADPRLARWLRAYASRRPTYRGATREDYVQEGLLAALELERAGREPDARAAFHYARSRISSRIRTEIRERRWMVEHGETMRAIDRSRPGERADVPAYLAELTARERQAVELRLWRGLSVREAAAAAGITAWAMDDRYGRAIARLRALHRGPDS